MKLSAHQMDAIRDAARTSYEESLIAHLRRHCPEQCADRDDADLGKLIQHGGERSGTYGITNERDVNRYVVVMLFLGEDFDTDPGLPWASQILTDCSIRDPSRRVEQLVVAAVRHVQENAQTA